MQNYFLTKNEAFDSITHFKENSERDWVECVQKIIRSKPFGDHKFYIHMFVKRVDDMSGVKKMYHHARLTKPLPSPGATLLRVDPKNPEDAVIMWTLPNDENFALYKSGKMFADPFVFECIEKYKKNPKELMIPEPDELSESKNKELLIAYLKKLKTEKKQKKLHL